MIPISKIPKKPKDNSQEEEVYYSERHPHH